jgi:hypothetical protein
MDEKDASFDRLRERMQHIVAALESSDIEPDLDTVIALMMVGGTLFGHMLKSAKLPDAKAFCQMVNEAGGATVLTGYMLSENAKLNAEALDGEVDKLLANVKSGMKGLRKVVPPAAERPRERTVSEDDF